MSKNLAMSATFFHDEFPFKYLQSHLEPSVYLWIASAPPLYLNCETAFLVEFDMGDEARCGQLPKQDNA